MQVQRDGMQLLSSHARHIVGSRASTASIPSGQSLPACSGLLLSGWLEQESGC